MSIPKGTEINYKNVAFLQKCLTERGKLFSRRLTSASATQQRQISIAVKACPFFGPFTRGIIKKEISHEYYFDGKCGKVGVSGRGRKSQRRLCPQLFIPSSSWPSQPSEGNVKRVEKEKAKRLAAFEEQKE
jgi:ribosomal protein S18